MTLDEAIKHSEEVAYQKDLESGLDTDNERYAMTDKERTACKECAKEHRQLAEWLRDYKRLLEQEICEDIMAIHTQGLDEEIRCIMCTNPMKSDRGCDGGCMIDEDMYKKVMDIIRNRIVLSATPTFNWNPVSEKLQKIEQIIKEHDEDRMPEDYFYIDKIREVIKNDN